MTSSASQQHLRLLMRQQMASKNDFGVNGKDKVKALKALKEQQKTQNTISATQQQRSSTSISGSNDNISAKTTTATACLPSGFFDDDTTRAKSASPAVAAAPTRTATTTTTAVVETKQPPSGSSVPTGFFDDVAEDYHARDMNYAQVLKEHEEQEQHALKSFMQEVGDMSEDLQEMEERALESEQEERDTDETLMQLSYVARYARLLHQSDRLLTQPSEAHVVSNSKNTSNSNSSGKITDSAVHEQVLKDASVIQALATSDDLDTVIEDSAGSLNVASSLDKHSNNNTERCALVEKVVQQKLREKLATKRSLEASLDRSVKKPKGGAAPSKSVSDDTITNTKDDQSNEDSDENESDNSEDDSDDEYSPLAFMNFSGKY
jgi:hypothetical protein